MAVSFNESYSVEGGSALAVAFAKALESAEEEDSEIQFVVLGLDEAGQEEEIGVARCSLEGLVKSGKDHSGVLQATNENGVAIGELTCAVTAIEALQGIANGGSKYTQAVSEVGR